MLQLDVVLDRRRRRDEVEIELPLQPFLDDLHVEQPQEPAAEPEPQRDRALGLEREARVVEVQLVECFAQHRVVLATDGIDAGEHEALGRLVPGERRARRSCLRRDGVADLCLADVLETGRDVAHLAGGELLDRHELRSEDAELQGFRDHAAGHEADRLRGLERALLEPDVDDDALVGVVVAVEDQALDRGRGIAGRRRDPFDDGLEDVDDAGPVLGAGEDDFLARDRQHVLELVDDGVRVGRGQVDLVEDGDEREVLAQGEVDVGERLRLDALGRIDDQDRAFARLQAVADLIGEVDVTGRVDQVEPVGLAILGGVLEPNGPGLDRDALLALEIHRIEDLTRHLPGVDRVCQLEQSIGQRRLPMIDMGDDREIPQTFLGDGHEAGV